MSNEVLKRDQNHVTVVAGVTDDAAQDVTMLRVDPVTKYLKVKATISGGSAVRTEVPAGDVNGVNTEFTFTVAPKVIVVDQSRTMMNGSGWSLLGLVATLDVAPEFEIFSIY